MKMLDGPQIQKMMKQIAAGIFPVDQLLEVASKPMLDVDGDEGISITLVMTDEAAQSMTGDQITALLRNLREGLLREGDERFPLVSYATPSDRGDETDED
jgi:hypothetical protein